MTRHRSDMSLLIDIGNSRLKWALASHHKGMEASHVEQHSGSFPEGLAAQWQNLPTPHQVIVSCVGAENIVSELQKTVAELWNRDIRRLVSTREFSGLMNCYEYPERLGVDRWMVMIGARQITEGPCCVIDAGTALTIDMIHGNGKHLGGLIVPGLSLMFGCLESGTAIPGYAEQLSDNNLGCSTNNAIQLGCLRALAGVVEKTLHDTGLVDPKVLLTGGDATLLASVVNYPLTIVPDLVLQGLLQFTDTD